MNFIHAQNHDAGALELAERIAEALNVGRPVLWLVCGGSNISTAAATLDHIRAKTDASALARLTLALTDERYGPVGHADSNWAQLVETGVDLNGFTSVPILTGGSLEETVAAYSGRIAPILNAVGSAGGLIIALFGIGPDGHIAGIIPHSPAVDAPGLVYGYDAGIFTRITLTAPVLKMASAAYVFAFGSSKKDALERLRDGKASFADEPAVILRDIPEAFVYNDQVTLSFNSHLQQHE